MKRRGSVGSVVLTLALVMALVIAAGCGGGGSDSDTGGGGDEDVTAPEDSGGGTSDTAATDDVACQPTCGANVCGDNGCGGTCGTCMTGFTCDAGQCVVVDCIADCADKQCGDDGCGGSCGSCEGCSGTDDGLCMEDGMCATPCCPDCGDRVCGDDGCGGACGMCDAGYRCEPDGTCVEDVCVPDCSGGPCSDDGCGNTCVGCPEGQGCSVSRECADLMDCAEYADCTNACDGDALCDDECDSRTSFEAWDAYGTFINCLIDNCAGLPDAQFNQCIYTTCGDTYYACYSGPENCGWLWGCVTHCEPLPGCFGECLVDGTQEAQLEILDLTNCIGAACGTDVGVDDPCWSEAVAAGGACAESGDACIGTCTPDCDGKQCGDSGCGYDCGPCEVGFICNDTFQCEECVVECDGATCGPSNCPGIDCGTCDAGWACEEGSCVELVHCAPEDATVITCDQRVAGDTGTGTNRFADYPCSSWPEAESGPELLYSFTAETDDTVVIALENVESGVDLDLFVVDSTCTAESCITLGDTGVTLDVVAGETYYVVVEGYAGAEGSFELVFDCASACADPACGDLECGPAPGDLCGGATCGECAEGSVCTPQGACIGDPCGGIDEVGCCQGDVVVWCENLTLFTLDCQTEVDEPTTCGYTAQESYFACGPNDPPPAGVEPECDLNCDATCEGEGVACGLLPACPLTDCGACESGFTCLFGECVEVTCDQTGFAADQQVATYVDSNGGLARYQGVRGTAEPVDLFMLELWYGFGAPTAPGSYEVQEQNYAECGLCVLGNLGCTQDGGCDTTFLGFAGTVEFTSVPSAVGQSIGGTVSNLQMREVTINSQAVSAVVPGGQVWCIDGFSFMATTQAGK